MTNAHDPMKTNAATVVEQQDALILYLDALLTEATEKPEPVIELRNVVAPVEPVISAAPVDAPVVTATPPANFIAAGMRPQQIMQTMLDPNAPPWASNGFQALSFQVGGLKLAVPLDQLHGILEWPGDAITPLFGHAGWFLGLLQNRETKVKVADIAQVVMPENRLVIDQRPARERASHIILVDEGRWGLACENPSEVIQLVPGDVRWRADQSRRRWLAGTAIKQMCAILNLDALLEELQAGLKPAATDA